MPNMSQWLHLCSQLTYTIAACRQCHAGCCVSVVGVILCTGVAAKIQSAILEWLDLLVQGKVSISKVYNTIAGMLSSSLGFEDILQHFWLKKDQVRKGFCNFAGGQNYFCRSLCPCIVSKAGLQME